METEAVVRALCALIGGESIVSRAGHEILELGGVTRHTGDLNWKASLCAGKRLSI